jgi:hypothetical protein
MIQTASSSNSSKSIAEIIAVHPVDGVALESYALDNTDPSFPLSQLKIATLDFLIVLSESYPSSIQKHWDRIESIVECAMEFSKSDASEIEVTYSQLAAKLMEIYIRHFAISKSAKWWTLFLEQYLKSYVSISNDKLVEQWQSTAFDIMGHVTETIYSSLAVCSALW